MDKEKQGFFFKKKRVRNEDIVLYKDFALSIASLLLVLISIAILLSRQNKEVSNYLKTLPIIGVIFIIFDRK